VPGDDLLSHTVARAVPSALKGLTAVFGKGTGVAPSLWSPGRGRHGPDNGIRLRSRRAYPGQATRPISTAQLHTLPCVHVPPINVVVFDGSVGIAPGSAHLEVGFPLRCFQRLSVPHIATQRCRWRDNWYTSGASIPVLSYWGQRLATLQRPRKIRTELSHDVLNPARVPL
jgi:hypothetical protein